MSIYLAHLTGANTAQTVSPAVQDRGLSLLRAKPCDVQVTVLPVSIQPGYACYVMNLPAFMEATLTSRRTLICDRGYPIHRVAYELPWTLPSLIYDFLTPPSERRIEELRTHSGTILGRGRTSYVMRSPTLEAIRTLVSIGANSHTSHVMGTVNLDAMKMVYILRKIFSAFLLTHVYPAFRHTSDLKPTTVDVLTTVTKKRKVSTTSYIACVTDVVTNLEDPVEIDEGSPGISHQRSTDIRLTNAKPTPISNDKWGAMENIPNASGLYVPYVKELASADTHTVPNLVSTTFVRCLSKTAKGMFRSMEQLRSAWGVIAQTDLGHEISHLAKCIEIALQAQSTVYPVYTNGIYEGTVICGAGYSMCIKDRVFEPLTYANLQEVVRDSSAHSQSLERICSVLREEHRDEISECRTMRGLSEIVKGIELDVLQRSEIVKAAHNLSYPSRYWSTATVNVKIMLDFLVNTEKAIPVDTPMHPKYLFSVDHMELVLSAFGHQAPTFMIPNGTRCDLQNVNPPSNFHVRTITVENAVLDMTYCMENGYITNNMHNLSHKHRDNPLRSLEKMEVWVMLKQMYSRKQSERSTVVTTEPEVSTTGDGIDSNLW